MAETAAHVHSKDSEPLRLPHLQYDGDGADRFVWMRVLLLWHVHGAAKDDESRTLHCVHCLSWTAVVSVPHLCGALHGGHTPHHLPESENREKHQVYKYLHWLRLAALFGDAAFSDFIQPTFTHLAIFHVLRLWITCYILLQRLCPLCSHSPRARESGWRQETGPPSKEEGISHHRGHNGGHVSEICGVTGLHCGARIVTAGIPRWVCVADVSFLVLSAEQPFTASAVSLQGREITVF